MNDEQRKRSAERSRIIAQGYAEWAKEQAGQFSPDPRYVAKAPHPGALDHTAMETGTD